MGTKDLTAAEFAPLVEANEIVLVDFWAAWCGPCLKFAPVYAAAAERHPEIVFGKVDTRAEQDLAAAAGIISIPTLMAFRDGIPLFSQAGALPADALEDVITAVARVDLDAARKRVASHSLLAHQDA